MSENDSERTETAGSEPEQNVVDIAEDGSDSGKEVDEVWQPVKLSTWTVLVIFLLAFGIRLGYVTNMKESEEFPDERQYLDLADNVVGDNGLILKLNISRKLYVQRPPMYPLMLAGIRHRGGAKLTIRVVQSIIGALTCVMIYALAVELVGPKPATVAGLIACIYPFFIYFTGLILSETLFLLFFVASWLYVVRTWKMVAQGGKSKNWAAMALFAGLGAGFAILTRPSVLPVFLAIPLLWVTFGPKRLKGLVASSCIFAAMLICMSPWVARNYLCTKLFSGTGEESRGRLVLTTLKTGESLYEAVGPFATGGPNKENTVYPEEVHGADEYERNRILLERSFESMKNNPWRVLRLAPGKFLRTWNVIPNYEKARSVFYRSVSILSYVPVLLTALIGYLVVLRRARVLPWILLPVVVLTLVHMIFVGSIRYRLGMIPFVIILSGVGTWWILRKVASKFSGATRQSA